MTESELLAKAEGKRVLFVGEKIIDVYHYVRPLGRPTKDAIVSVELINSEQFEGGLIAAKNHAANFCHVSWQASGRILQKERYIEQSHLHKLFECYRDQGASSKPLPNFRDYDCVVVCDYGHGMADSRFIAALESARYLAINVQTNSGNYGFNLATKYRRSGANYLCVDEPEARLATQNRSGPIEDSLEPLSKMLTADKVVITLGKNGAIGLCDGDVMHCKAFTDRIVDTMGAGDAFFALSAIVAKEAPMENLLRIGNAAGAVKSGIVGHRASVTKAALLACLESGQCIS